MEKKVLSFSICGNKDSLESNLAVVLKEDTIWTNNPTFGILIPVK